MRAWLSLARPASILRNPWAARGSGRLEYGLLPERSEVAKRPTDFEASHGIMALRVRSWPMD